MKLDTLNTPVYVKEDENFTWPKDRMFYLLTRDGMMICRNHPWFKSCAPAKKGPSDLANQEPFCSLSYPRIPRLLMEKAVGFFARVYDEHKTESAVLIVFNKLTNQVELLCPQQKVSWGSVKYEVPNLENHLLLIGDMHSHGDWKASPSMTDENDEMGRAGLHLIVGDITKEPPDLFCAVVADGQRFDVKDLGLMLEDYIQRDQQFPKEWMSKLKVEKYAAYTGTGYSDGGTGWTYKTDKEQAKEDAETIRTVLAERTRLGVRPDLVELRAELFRRTRRAAFLKCESEASEFIRSWKKGDHEKQVA